MAVLCLAGQQSMAMWALRARRPAGRARPSQGSAGRVRLERRKCSTRGGRCT